MEYFGSKQEMRAHFEGGIKKFEDMEDEFRKKYEKTVNCEALFEDIKNMYSRDKKARSILTLHEREEYKMIDPTDFHSLVGAFAFRFGQLPDERKEYTYKKHSPDATPGQE